MTGPAGELEVVSDDSHTAAVLRAALDRLVDPPSMPVTVAHFSERVDPALVRALAERMAVVVMGPDREPDLVEAMDAGAAGYLLSDASVSEVVAAIRSVDQGTAVVPPLMLGNLLRHVVDRHRRLQAATAMLDELTPRERDVLELAARGAKRDEIAAILFISPATARTHLQRIMAKLGVHSQAELVARAADLNLIEETR
jgi:DNA-binding NarL/FixJ family response regulator